MIKYWKKMGKRSFALFLALAMCLGMVSQTALAADIDQVSVVDDQVSADTQANDNGTAALDNESAAVQPDNADAVGGESDKTENEQFDEQENAVGSDVVTAANGDNADNAEDSEEVTAESIEYTEGSTTYMLNGDGTATLTKGEKDEDSRIVVPDTVTKDGKEYKVTVIGERAFAKLDYVQEIVLPDGLEIIGKEAFLYDYLYDNDLIIPDSVVEIGENAFFGFHMNATEEQHIEKIVLGKNLKTIGKQAFCFSATQGNKQGLNFKVKLECYPNIESVGTNAFAGTSSKCVVSEITIHDGYEGQLDAVLNKCTALKNVNKIYELGIDRNNILNLAVLRKAIAEAEEGEPVILKLAKGFIPSGSSIIIPEGKDITITDNGNKITIDSAGFNKNALFVIEEGGKLTIDPTTEDNIVIKGVNMPALNNTGDATLFQVNGTLVMKGGVIRGGEILDFPRMPAPLCGVISVREKGAKFLMEGGTITESIVFGPHVAQVVVGSGAEFEMTGGNITGNTSNTPSYVGTAASAVLVYGWNKGDEGGKMTLSGDAVISENKNTGFGGAVTLVGNAELYMDGGVITGNQSIGGKDSNGGGVCVVGRSGGMDEDYDPKCVFTMDGGVISNNSAEYGGGIYINSNDATLNAGEITGNKAYMTGGGVYVETPQPNPNAVQMKNVLITQNTASVMGGGMYFCPTGTGTLYVDEGAAIFDNVAGGDNPAAGDDFVYFYNVIEPTTAVLAPRMLGGGLVEWYQDGSVEEPALGGWGFVTDELPRYDSGNPQRVEPGTYPKLDVSAGKEPITTLALKSVGSDEAKQLAADSATLIIKNNTAVRGGGVGANGAATVGSDEKFNVNVHKVWDSSVPANEWKPVTVQLVMNANGKEYALEIADLNAGNNWNAVFADLPESLKGQVSVKELDSGYDVAYDRNDNGNDVSYTITNSKQISLTSLTVNKEWVNDSESTRPAEVMVQLYDNGEASGEAVKLNADNEWSYTWDNLPADGHEWTVGEVTVPVRYTSSQTVAGNVVTITNTYTPPKGPGTSYGSLTVNKVWANDSADSRPDSVSVQLYRDGSAYGRAVTLSADNDWSYTWNRLNKFSDWTVGEVDVPTGYTSAVSRSGSTVTITNTYSDTEINEPDVPLTDKPGNPDDPAVPKTNEEVDLPDPDVPLANNPGVSKDVELNDPAVPLSGSPKTGDDSFPWLWVVIASGLGLALLAVSERKRRGNAD